MTTYPELLKGYGEVFRELTAPPLNLQEAILFGERREDIALEVVEGPASIGITQGRGSGGTELEAVEGKIDVGGQRWPAVRLANIAYGHERVLIVVNSATQPVRVRVRGIPAAAGMSVLSGDEAAKVKQGEAGIEMAMEPFAAVVVKVAGR